MNIDKIFEEMQIQVYNYRQRNAGKSPYLIIGSEFFIEMSQYMTISMENSKTENRLLGCNVNVMHNLKLNQFIIGEKMEVPD